MQAQALTHPWQARLQPSSDDWTDNLDFQLRSSITSPQAALLADRFLLQAVARGLAPKDNRVKWCLRRAHPEHAFVQVWKTGDTATYRQVIACKQVWACPVCAARISERRRGLLVRIGDAHIAAGGTALFLTLTVRHGRGDDLSEIRLAMETAWRTFTQSRPWRALRKTWSFIGSVRAMECTWGQQNGFHPHLHLILYFDSPVIDPVEWHDFLYPAWASACIRADLPVPTARHGLHIRLVTSRADLVALYVAKFGIEPSKLPWGPEDEITRTHAKVGRVDRYSAWDFLRAAYGLPFHHPQRQRMAALYRAFLAAFKGARQLVISNGLAKRYGVEDATDEELHDEVTEADVLLAQLTLHDWARVVKADARGTLLALATSAGADGVHRLLLALRAMDH